MFYLTTHSTHFIYSYMASDHSDSEKGNPLPPHRLLLSINSKGSFICTIPQTGLCYTRSMVQGTALLDVGSVWDQSLSLASLNYLITTSSTNALGAVLNNFVDYYN